MTGQPFADREPILDRCSTCGGVFNVYRGHACPVDDGDTSLVIGLALLAVLVAVVLGAAAGFYWWPL
jgi:hypothetical protein